MMVLTLLFSLALASLVRSFHAPPRPERCAKVASRQKNKQKCASPVGRHDDAGPVERVGAGVALDAIERELRRDEEDEQADARVEDLFPERDAALRGLDVRQHGQEGPHEFQRPHRFFLKVVFLFFSLSLFFFFFESRF